MRVSFWRTGAASGLLLAGLLEDAFESEPASGDAFAGVLQGVGYRRLDGRRLRDDGLGCDLRRGRSVEPCGAGGICRIRPLRREVEVGRRLRCAAAARGSPGTAGSRSRPGRGGREWNRMERAPARTAIPAAVTGRRVIRDEPIGLGGLRLGGGRIAADFAMGVVRRIEWTEGDLRRTGGHWPPVAVVEAVSRIGLRRTSGVRLGIGVTLTHERSLAFVALGEEGRGERLGCSAAGFDFVGCRG